MPRISRISKISDSEAGAAARAVIALHETALLSDLVVFRTASILCKAGPEAARAGQILSGCFGRKIHQNSYRRKTLERRKYRQLVFFAKGNCKHSRKGGLCAVVRWSRQLTDWTA
jgi:hypothetical protein